PVRPMDDMARSGVASSTLKVTGGSNASAFGHLSRYRKAISMRSWIIWQASDGAMFRAANRPSPSLTVAVTTDSPISVSTSRHVAASPETNIDGTPKLPATAATIPDSPTNVPLIVAFYQDS